MPTNKEQKKEWFEGWFDENYLLLYSHRNRSDAKEQINLIIDTLKPPKEHSILDLACGEGRYTTLLHELGYHNITGLDLSQTLINSGKKKYPYLDLHVGDMRSIKGKYDLILSLFTAFGYFQSDEENENVLQGIYNSLKPDGTYWFDFLNAQQVEKDMVPRSVSNPAPGVEVTETRKIENGRIIKDIVFKRETRKQERDIDPDYSHHSFNSDNTTSTIKTCNSYDSTNTHYRESVRLFTREQLQDMFKRRGFRIIEEYGDFHGNPWTTLSPRTILVGRREQ